ncbi:unnamed protein product [Schistosoma turkestanicum]|nr:unnamed protein product [Schistosoma turkestanicum]
MKTRGSVYRSDFKKTYVPEKSVDRGNSRTGEQKQKSDKVKKVVSRTKRQRISETYKSSHLVGRRRASNFVTYTQNGRLFYDIYVRESPYRTNKLVSSIQKESADDGSYASLTHPTNSKLRRKNVGTKSGDSTEQDSSQKAFVVRGLTKTSKKIVRPIGSVHKSAKSLNKDRKCRNKSSNIDKSLKRELGPDYISPVEVHGKRLASLNATAIIGAFNSKSPRKAYIKKKKSEVLSESGLTSAWAHSDDIDDAITEPMCSVVDDDIVHCLETPDAVTPQQNKPLTTQKSPVCTPVKEIEPSSFKNICQINPAIESFHSQRIIPLGHDTFGVQQITHQVVVVPHSNETSPIMCHSKLPDFGTPIVHPSSGSTVPFPMLSCLKPSDCNFTDTSLQRQHNQVMYNQFYPTLPPQYVHSWNSTLPCITNSNITPSFVACSPPNVILPHLASPLVVPNPGVTSQLAYPLVLQPFSNIPVSCIGPSLPYGLMSPVFLPTWTQPSLLPCQSFNTPVNSSAELLCPMMISPTQMVPNTQPQFIQVPSNQCISLLPQTGLGQLTLNQSTVIPKACSSSNQPTSSHHSKPNVENHLSTCYSISEVNEPILCQTPHTNIPDETTEVVLSSNAPVLCKKTEKSPLSESNSFGMKSLAENRGKKPSPTIVCLDNQKDAWVWEGSSFDKHIFLQSDAPPVLCQCYPAIRHRRDGMVIRVKDSVLLCSGPSRSHPPHIAKIIALYHDKNTDTKMMSLLWYYRPEHISGASQNFVKNELYASRHRDTNPLDCIEDKAYVLSVSAYSRYMAKLKRQQTGYRRMPLSSIVPQSIHCGLHSIKNSNDDFFMDKQFLSECDECFNSVSSQSVFFCRGLYDYKLKRVTKYPVFGNQCILSSQLANRPKSYGQNFTTPATLTIKSVTEQNNLNLSNDQCCDTSTSHKEDVPKIVNAFEPINSLEESVPSKVCSISITSFGENVNTTISPFQLAENDCHFVNNSCMNGECEPLSYDSHEGRTSTPVKSCSQYKAPIEENITTVGDSQQTLMTKDISNSPPKTYPSADSCVQIPKPDLLVSEASVNSPNIESQFTSSSSSERKLCEVNKNSLVQSLETNCLPAVIEQIPCENKPENHFVCQSDFSPIHPVWPVITTSVVSCDRSVLERSADISVNWGEHGEQIALSLDCRTKESSLNGNGQTTSHMAIPSESLGPTQSFIDMTKLPVHPNPIHYSNINSKCLDQDQLRLVIL